MTLQGQTIVVTGATGQVGFPVAAGLAKENTVIAPARFSDPAQRDRLEAAGVTCVIADLGAGQLDAVPVDADYVLNFAVAKTNNWDADLAANAEGAGLLMAHCKSAKAFLHCSTTGVYHDTGGGPYKEDDPLGDNHRVSPFLQTYPIHEDDIVAMVPKFLDAAAVPAVTINWGGEDVVSIQDWCAYLTELTGVEIPLTVGPTAMPSVVADVTKQHEIAGKAEIGWRDG